MCAEPKAVLFGSRVGARDNKVSHRDFQELIEGHSEEFGAAADALTEIVLGVLGDRITPQDAEGQLFSLVADMQRRSTQWVMSVLPAVVTHATAQTDSELGSEPSESAPDAVEQAVALELASLKLEEALHNIAHQMARDARQQIREGLQIELEEQLVAMPRRTLEA